jgi:uncharacterized protein
MQKPFKAPYTVHDSHLGHFTTASGVDIDLLNPQVSDINIDDISHALSNICRFGGHCFPFYSVAQHSCIVAALAPQELKLAALLHDAAEAYLGDVIKPLKLLIGERYTQFEALFELVIGLKFGVDYSDLNAIKQYDKLALEIENEALRHNNYARLITVMEQSGLLKNDWAWLPAIAEHEFLTAFQELYHPELNPMPSLVLNEENPQLVQTR